MPGWRLRARATIRQAIADNPHLRGNFKAMMSAIDGVYPFGERRYTPYAVWLEERAKALDELATEPIHRLCKVCRARPLRACRDVATGEKMSTFHEYRIGKSTASGPLFDT